MTLLAATLGMFFLFCIGGTLRCARTGNELLSGICAALAILTAIAMTALSVIEAFS